MKKLDHYLSKLDKYIPSLNSKTTYIVIGIVLLVLIGSVKRNNDGGLKVGNTFLVMKNYDEISTLTGDEQTKYEDEVAKYDKLINDAIASGNKSQIQENWFLAKSVNLALLGRYNEAIKTANKIFSYYSKSNSALDLLAAIYNDVGEYYIAIDYYKQLIEMNPDAKADYTKKIIQTYINKKDGEKAGQMYIDYIKMGGEKDMQLMNQIRELKGLGQLESFEQPTFK